MTAPGPRELDVQPAPSPNELAAIVAALAQLAPAKPENEGAQSQPSRWRMSTRRYDGFDEVRGARNPR